MNPPAPETGPPPPTNATADTAPSSAIDRENWNTAPRIVQFARGLAYLNTALCGMVFIFGLLEMGRQDGFIGGLFYTVAGATFMLVHLWLIPALRWGKKEAWGLQQCVSILGLFVCGIGTILHTYILLKWNRAETKTWFGK